MNLDIPFYLGVWIYNPRLPKSEVVCAIEDNKIDYYKNKCFDVFDQQNNLIDLKDFKIEKNNLVWTKKIDFDTLEDWEINIPKESYENKKHWMEFQEYFKNFINNSYKIEKNKNGYRDYKNVGEIWTGELMKK